MFNVGDSVFYRDERYWVETLGENFIRIADCHIRPEVPAPLRRASFYVPNGLVTGAPTTRNRYGRQPTKKAVDKREQQRADGIRDCGDEVAALLRACATLDDVFIMAAEYLGSTAEELQEKYAHLDNGRKRMCLGNRLRSYFKKENKHE